MPHRMINRIKNIPECGIGNEVKDEKKIIIGYSRGLGVDELRYGKC